MPRILIVDDDPDIVESTTIVLENEGYEVVSASNVADGTAMLVSEKPDLLILDVMMDAPDDGFVMAQDIRVAGHTLPIVMLTSVGKAFGLKFESGNEMIPVNEFLEKPADPRVLVAKIKALLKKN